jgi:hypothetical protein
MDLCIYLYVYCLFNDAVSNWSSLASNEKMVMDSGLERVWMEAVGLDLLHCPGICLDGQRKTMETLSHFTRYPIRDLNSDVPNT